MFGSNKYAQRYEFVRFQLDNVIVAPGNGQHQQKNGYKFTVNDRSSIYDCYNAYFEVQFRLNKLDGTGGYPADIHDNNRATVINGAHSLINKMTIRSAGKIVYDTSNLHKAIFVKNLLQYSDDFSRSVAKNSFWYLDSIDSTVITDNDGDELGYKARRRLTAADRDVNVIIPLNRYGFFEVLSDRVLVPMQLQFEINLQNDRELIHKSAGAAGRVAINRFYLWFPKIIPTDKLSEEFTNFLFNFEILDV